MPGSYRSITHIMKRPEMPKVKAEEEIDPESESSPVEENQEVESSKWSLEENLKFAIFVHYYENIFASKRKRKLCKIFKSQAEYLERRTPTQCRSHFQKMMAKHKSIARMKKYYKSTLGNQQYLKEFYDFKKAWQENHQPLENVHPELRETKEISIQTDELPESVNLCGRCRGDERSQQQNAPQYYPIQFNQMNPLMFWFSGGQSEIPTGNFMMWLPPNSQQDGSS